MRPVPESHAPRGRDVRAARAPRGGSAPVWARRVALAVVVLYPIGAGILLLWPSGWMVNRLNVRVWFAVTSVLGVQDRIGPDRFADLLNVLLFVPVFAALAVLRPRWWWAAAGVAISGAVETYQHVIGTRVASLVDVLMNSLGALVGVAIGIAITRCLEGRGRRADPPPPPRGTGEV